MSRLHTVIVEDSDDDAALIVLQLRRGGFDVSYERVQTADALQAALATRLPDVVICDYNLPSFSAEDALGIDIPLTHKRANQYLLARLLRRKAEILEIPVRFFPLSPERVKRTSVFEGIQSLGALMSGRLRPAPAPRPAGSGSTAGAAGKPGPDRVAAR